MEALLSNNRQLDAFQRALRLAIQCLEERLPKVNISAQVQLFYEQGRGLPTIDIIVPSEYDNAILKSEIACFLLRCMLKIYVGFIFPDHVDFRDGGAERGTMLFPYRSQQEGPDNKEAARVRRQIAIELYYRSRESFEIG